jgi:Tol biopolymer transport system component
MPFQQASFSPDGNEIVFAWNWGKDKGYDIYREMIGPGGPLQLTTDPADDLRPAWSPDGRFIAFMRVLESGKYAVLLIPALGGGAERRLADCDYPSSLAWSLDNRWLVVTDRDTPGQPGGLYLVSIETGEKKRLTSPPANSEGDMDASFSPDGRSLAFVRALDLGVNDIFRISLSSDLRPSGEPERLTYENRYIQSPVWTRDRQAILYSDGSWWSSGRVVRRILLSASKGPAGYPVIQEPFGEDATHLAMSPSGRRLVYTRTFSDTNIYRLEVTDQKTRVGVPETFIASTRNDLGPSYSPDGKTIAFMSTRLGTQEIWLCNSDGSSSRQLTSMGGPLIGGAGWSPDGETLVFDSRKKGTSDLYLISSDGGAVRRLTSDPGYEGAATWSRDGKWIYFESDRSGRSEVYKMPSRGGDFMQVTKNGGHYACESFDAKWLYYDKDVDGGIALWKTSVSRGDEVEINPGPLYFYGEFVVLDDGLFLKKTNGDLDFIDIKTGITRTIAHLEKPLGLGLSVSPDRRWILMTLLDQNYNDLMLVENFR